MGPGRQRRKGAWKRIALIILAVAPIVMLAALVVLRLSR